MILSLLSHKIPGGLAHRSLLTTPPPQRRFPVSSGEWSTWFPAIVAGRGAPTSYWSCQEASSPLVDLGASADLAGTGATPLYQQAGDPLGRYSVGFSSGAARFQAASAAVLDVALEDVTLLARCYMPSGSANFMPIMRKRNAAASSNGYVLGATGSTAHSGQVTFDGGVATSATEVLDHSAQWLDFVGVLDRTGGEVRLYSALGTEIIALNPSTLSLTNATDIFAIGDANGVTSEPGALISYAAVWVGAAFDADDYTDWITPV